MKRTQNKERTLEGLEKTLEVLTKTNNEAAVSVLVPALDSPHPAIQEGALRAIMDRRSPTGQREVLRRLHTAGDAWKTIINERRGRMGHALRDAVLSGDGQMCANACQAILWFREYDLMSALITAAEDDTHANAELAAKTLLALAERLYEELSAPRDYNDRRDPQMVRNHVTTSLEGSVLRFARHRRSETTAAFLILANRDNATLKQILQDPHHPSYLSLVNELLHDTRGGILRLLLSFLDDPHAPSAALSVLARRNDAKFIRNLLKKVGFEPSAVALQNLKRMENIVWLRGDFASLDELDDAGQHSAVQIAMASSLKRDDAFKAIEYLLIYGKPLGRRAAAKALARFNGADANALALQALGDIDPEVQAAIVLQLRPRGIPGALARLIELVDSPYDSVRNAARESLSEFDFERFLAAFDLLDDEVRHSTGVLVRKVNANAVELLAEEMRARSRTRRLRALGMAGAMECVGQMEVEIIQLLADEDHVVRAEAARALGQCKSSAAQEALREALLDRSVVVQEAAERSLHQLNGGLAEMVPPVFHATGEPKP